jgi:NitT/TauT family transport system substrate-binding protein
MHSDRVHQRTGGALIAVVRRWRVVTPLVAAMTFVISGCGSSNNTPAPSGPASSASAGVSTATGPGTPAPKPLAQLTKVTAADAVSLEVYDTMLLADYFGEFRKENLDVSISTIPVPAAVAALQSGSLDVYTIGVSAAVLNAQASGSDIRFVAATGGVPQDSDLQGFWIRSDLVPAGGTFDPCKMKGLTVSVGGSAGTGASDLLFLQGYLTKCQLTIKDVKISSLGGPNELIALQQKSIDAGFLADPLWQTAQSGGYAKPLIIPGKSTPTLGGYLMGALRTQHPDVAQAFVRAMIRTSRTYLQGDYHANPTVLNALASELHQTASVITTAPSQVFDPDLIFRTDGASQLQQIWLGVGGVLNYSTSLSSNQIYDPSILKAVIGKG